MATYNFSSIRRVSDTLKIVQPQFIRSRHAYRSPIRSEKTNLEMSQIQFDIIKLYKKTADLRSKIDNRNEVIFGESVTLPASALQLSWSASQVQLGLQQMASKLDKLNQRIAVLERGLE